MKLHKIFLILILYFPSLSFCEDIWLLVDTQQLELSVKSGEKTLMSFPNISIGRNGSGFKQKRGDDITPLGKYRISWINRKSRYNIFYGFNYPSIDNVNTAIKKGLINRKTYQTIVRAHNSRNIPPQNTPLGGMIGIHGLGKGEEKIHEAMNWTHGCIALNNEQILKLDKLIKKNTIVVVK